MQRNVLLGIFIGIVSLVGLIWGLQRLTTSQMGPMMQSPPVPPGDKPFALTVSLSPQVPVAATPVEITVEIASQTSPHTPAVVRFWVDGEEVHQATETIPPFQTATIPFQWDAISGTHLIRIEVTSRAGVVYDFWEREVEVGDR